MRIQPGGAFTPFGRDQIEQSLQSRFRHQVRLHPDRTAIRTSECRITYSELDRSSDRVAGQLLATSGRTEVPVALLFDQGTELVAAILGVLKAGSFYVPIDPTYPPARIRSLLAESQAASLLSDRANLSLARELFDSDRVICINEADPSLSGPSDQPAVSGDAFAYVFFTSGSTGKPKGVVDNHRNVLHNIMRYTNSLCIGPQDRLTLLQSCSFSGSVSSLFCALLNGAACFPIDPRKQSAAGLARWVIDNQLTMWHSVPALFQLLCSSGQVFPSIRLIRLEGDQASTADVALYRRHFASHCVLVNGLGATETGLSRQFFIDMSTGVESPAVPVGYPVQDMEVVVLDEDAGPCRPHCVGEIAVKSRYLAVGYWRQPELTARSFRPCPEEPGVRLYLTGDLGRMHQDGCLEHLGRRDFQVKIAGNRIDLQEIESALRGYPGICQAVVSAGENKYGEKRLVAYVVTAEGRPPANDALREFLLQKLPASLIPSWFVTLDSLPVNENGKVERRALPLPPRRRPELRQPLQAARSESERRLASLWSAVLDLDEVGIDDNFFDLGGHSLDVGRVLTEVNLPVEFFFRYPTIREQAAQLELARPGRTPTQTLLVPLRRNGQKAPWFCVPGHDGTLLGYSNLARCLPPDRPVFGFATPRFETPADLFSMRELSERYLAAMREVQPHGPYLLTGYCFGGCVALEMARRLCDQGEQVALLVLILCFNDRWLAEQPAGRRIGAQLALGTRIVRHHARASSRDGIRGAIAYLRARRAEVLGRRRERRMQRLFDRCARQNLPFPPHLREARFANRVAFRSFDSPVYSGPVLLINGVDPRAGYYSAPLMGWAGLMRGDVQVEDIPDELRGLLAEPAVRLVAEKLAAAVTP